MPIHRPLFALVCALLGLCGDTIAHAASSTGEPHYSLRVWETEDGLPDNSVSALAQTRDGFLWLGTQNGLARFDGRRFQVFDRNNTPGLPDNHISCLFEDSARNLWIGTRSAGTVVMKDGHVSAPAELAAGGAGRALRAAAEDTSGAVWLLHENGDLWRYARGKYSPFVPPRGESEGRAIIHETNGPVWVATVRQQYAIGPVADNGSLELPLAAEPLSFGRLDMLASSLHGGYWRLANGRVQRITGEVERDIVGYQWTWEVWAACEDHDGNLMVGTRGSGAFVVTPTGRVTAISTNEVFANARVASMLVDREGNLWVGTDGRGLYRARQSFTVIDATRTWKVRSVAGESNGVVWTCSDQGLGRLANGALLQYWKGDFLSVFVDRDQRTWIGTERAQLFRYRNGGFEGFPAESLIQNPVQAIHQDRGGRIWFGTAGGLVRLDNEKWRSFTTTDGLSSDNITSLADDAEGNVWIGTQHSGLNRWHDDRVTVFRKSDGAPSDEISGLLVDQAGTLWVSTPSGLGRFARGKWTRYTTQQGLATDQLTYLIEDAEGNLWLGSNAGILRVQKKALNDVASGVASAVPCRVCEKGDGLLTRECLGGAQPGAWRASDGTLWFATSKGLASVDPTRLRPNSIPPEVIIESIVVNDVRVSTVGNEALTMRPGDERLEIHYTSLNLSAPERARFRYKMDGLEKNWTETGADERVAHYNSKLPPGRYTFRVSAANEDGVWNESGASLALVVQPPPPPLWKRWWFIGGNVLFILGLVAAVVYHFSTQRLQRQLAVMRQQKALEKERARIARDIHDQVGASLTQVALLGELVETDKDEPAEVEAHAKQISQTARETTRALDEIVWTVNPQNDTLEGLVNYICKYAQDYLAVAGVRYRFDMPAELPVRPIAPDVRHNVFLASKEAVTNIVRHAKGTAAWVRLRVEPASVILEIEDNGRGVAGLDPNAARTRHGLSNMRKRMEDIGGNFSIGPGAEGGALVRLTVPLDGNPALAQQ